MVNAKTRLYAILGDPVDHSLSPVIMNSSFDRLGMDCVFLALRVGASEIRRVFPVLKKLGLKGYVLTMPVKELVEDFLDDISEEARLIGAVNCIHNQNGKLTGHNTDSIGFWNAIQEKAKINHKIKKIFLFGAGGFSKAVAAQAALQGVGDIVVVNRREDTSAAEGFLSFSRRLTGKLGVRVKMLDWKPALWLDELRDAQIVANASPVGLHGFGELHKQFPYECAGQDTIFFDAVYEPLETAFLSNAKAHGHTVVSGLDLLAHQGACSFQVWTGVWPDPAGMRQDALSFLSITENIAKGERK